PANSWPGTTESKGARSGDGAPGTVRRYCAAPISPAALPVATTVAPALRPRLAPPIPAGRLSSVDAVVQTGQSEARAATGPRERRKLIQVRLRRGDGVLGTGCQGQDRVGDLPQRRRGLVRDRDREGAELPRAPHVLDHVGRPARLGERDHDRSREIELRPVVD